MNAIVYNGSLAAALVCVATGCALKWGSAAALIVTGALVMALTVFGAVVSGRPR